MRLEGENVYLWDILNASILIFIRTLMFKEKGRHVIGTLLQATKMSLKRIWGIKKMEWGLLGEYKR